MRLYISLFFSCYLMCINFGVSNFFRNCGKLFNNIRLLAEIAKSKISVVLCIEH